MARRENLNVTNLNLGGADVNRDGSRKVLMALTGLISYNVASPYTVSLGKVPKGAVITHTVVEIVTAFNAVTTNVLEVGTSGTANAYVAAADVNETVAGTTVVAKSAATTAETEVFAKFTQTGGAATAGQARCTVHFLV